VDLRNSIDIGAIFLQSEGMLVKYQKVLCACVAVFTVIGCAPRIPEPPAETVSLESLLSRLTNVTAMAEQPLGRSFLVSSYDRSGGNRDWATWNRAEADGRITLLAVDGPGYVSRIWCTNLRKIEEWAFFFDGESTPRLSLTHNQLFNDQVFPFVAPLAGESGGGRYSLMPIPFSKSLRIAIKHADLNPADRNYFHINYTKLYDKHTLENSWPQELSNTQSNVIRQVVETWQTSSEQLSHLGDAFLEGAEAIDIPAGDSYELINVGEHGLIDGFAVEIRNPKGGEALKQEVLRNLRVKFWWDGASVPSVDVPLGDFFCNPLYPRAYSSYFMGNVNGKYVSRLPMPFRRGARGVIENIGDVPVRLRIGVSRSDNPGTGRLFHANWAASTTSGHPLDILNVKGAGHYVGMMLTSIGQDGSWNILEGDESVWPDPDTEPVQHGTGLEDYFNGAYYYTSLFDLPQHGLIEKGAMRTDQYRWHGLEAVDFAKRLDVDIEFGHGNHSRGYMSSVAYWYADRPHNVKISAEQEKLLARPQDRFELPGFMAQLFTLERAGLYGEAADRCEFMQFRYRHQPWSEIFGLRATAYKEQQLGFDAVESTYERFAASKHPDVSRQAKDLLWFHESPNHALLGAHVRGKYRLLLDGDDALSGDTHAVLQMRRLIIPEGEHTWEVEMTPTMQGSMFSLCLRTHKGDITSAGDWTVVEKVLVPGEDFPGVAKAARVLPNMTVWQFQPNAYVGMQSPAQGLEIWPFYAAKPRVQIAKFKAHWHTDDAMPISKTLSTFVTRSETEERAHAVD